MELTLEFITALVMIILMIGALPYAVSKMSKTESDTYNVAKSIGASFDLIAMSEGGDITIERKCPSGMCLVFGGNKITAFKGDCYTKGGSDYFFMYDSTTHLPSNIEIDCSTNDVIKIIRAGDNIWVSVP